MEKFNDATISDEEKNEVIQLERETELQYMQDDAQIQIYNDEQIMEKFMLFLDELSSRVIDEYHFRDDLEISYKSFKTVEQNIIKIISRVIQDVTIFIKVEASINSEPGGHSLLFTRVFINEQKETSYEMEHINGEAYFNSEQGNYMPSQENKLIPFDLEDFICDLNTFVDEHLPNKVNDISFMEYSNIKDGGEGVVADYPCEECGELTVSIYEGLHEFGVCVNCGHDQSDSIRNCNRCDYLYNTNIEGGGIFCESCIDFIKEQ